MQHFGALDRQLRARFARGQRKLPLLRAIKGMILVARQPQSGECRFMTRSAKPNASNISIVRQATPSAWPIRRGPDFCSTMRVVMSGNAALAQSDLQALLRRYGGTTAAIQARMLLAQVLFGQGKVDEGLKELDAVSSPGPFAASLHALKGAGLEQS